MDAFPLPYATWYAATLFLDAGHPPEAVLARLGMDEAAWGRTEFYSYLRYADISWVASAFRREGLPDPEDPALYAHLVDGPVPPPPHEGEPDVRSQLRALRRLVERDPYIGPFVGLDWPAHYIGERSFPTIRYVHDRQSVRVAGRALHDKNGELIAGIDPWSFRLLGDRWFRDAKRVYCQGETPTKTFWFVVRGADPDSFEVLNERYARDRAAGYYSTGRRLPTADPGTFEVVGYPYGFGQKPGFHIDKSHFARDGRHAYAYGARIEGAHGPTFQAMGNEGKFFADKNRIYCEGRVMAEADRETFTCASEQGQYKAFDKTQPYWQDSPLSVAAEFEDWRDYFAAHPEFTDTWWHREAARRAAPGAEPQPIGGPYFSDGSRILVRNSSNSADEPRFISLDAFDAPSFRHLAGVFGVDRAGLRFVRPQLQSYGTDPVKGADPDTFVALGDHWFRCARQAYFFDVDDYNPELVIAKADMTSFEILGGDYARDAKGLLCRGVRKRDIADASTVRSLGFGYARMGSSILHRGKPVTRPGALDVETARARHRRLLMDAAGHMLVDARYRKPLPGLDPVSFTFLNGRFAVDRDRVYGLSDTNLLVCPIADRASTQAAPQDQITDRDGRIAIVTYPGTFKRVSAAEAAEG